jgi:phenylacetic acid degradation operon negative regulatory protein
MLIQTADGAVDVCIIGSMTGPMTDRAMRPRSGSSAKALLLTTLGEFVLPHGGSVWTSTVVSALAVLGVEERNARQAVARLADQGILRSEKEGRKARWHLTDQGSRLLTVGSGRIYQFGAGGDTWDERWLVVLCSVPEDQRAKRHQLRSQLGFAGFGFLAPGVAISPHLDREDAANAVLKDLGLLPGAVVLRAETGELVAPDELLRRAWDLDSLASGYDGFIAAFKRRSPRSDEANFAALVDLVHAWRRFPFVDPEIPARLLPSRWPGTMAKELFDARHAAWSPGANAWYEEGESAAD